MRSSILQSFLLCRSGLYRGAWRLQYHVPRAIPIANHGGFHSKTSLKGGEALRTKLANGAGSKTIQGGPNTCFMITSSRPSVTKYRDILDRLSKLLSTPVADVGHRRNPAIIILATPAFTTWLENKDFMGSVLERIFPAGSGTAQALSSDVTALVAVVDGLPKGRHDEVEQVTGGFAFLLCDHLIALPELWQRGVNNTTDVQSNHPRSGIIFRMRSNSNNEGGLEVGVPLANTLFRNGRTSTLFASKWNRTGSTNTFERTQQVEKKSVTIYPASSSSMVPLNLEIPLVPLTPLRQVVSGLGNILRQVADAKGNVVSASQELEAIVDLYLEKRSLDKQTVKVWALIIPNSTVMGRTSEDILDADLKKIQSFWVDTPDSSKRFYVGHWLKKGRGTTLHRVLSGGGGWGLKQGLLSLDPETSLFSSADTSQKFDSGNSEDDDQTQALGNIAKPGSWVQFLISHNAMSSRPTKTVDFVTMGPEFESAANLYFGCIASTVDDLPQSSQDLSILSDDSDLQPSLKGHYGHFGAMSEAGIFIRATENGAVTSSKIDVPNSEFHFAVVDREEP